MIDAERYYLAFTGPDDELTDAPTEASRPCALCGTLCVPDEGWPAPFREYGDFMDLSDEAHEFAGVTYPPLELGKTWICTPCYRILDRIYDMFDGSGRPIHGLTTDARWEERIPLFIEALRDQGIWRTLMGKGVTTVAAAVRIVMEEHRRVAELLQAVLQELPDGFEEDVLGAARQLIDGYNSELPPGAPKECLMEDLLGGGPAGASESPPPSDP